MFRLTLLLLALSGGALAAQDLPADLAPDLAPGPGGVSAEAETATDPTAAWEADPTAPLDAADVDLAAFAYLARPLVVFADTPRDPQFIEQMRLLGADPASLAARDVAVIVDADPDARSAVRATLRPRGFGLVLMDKDGRVVQRRPSPQTVREVGRAIDRMPLRIEELRNRGAEAG